MTSFSEGDVVRLKSGGPKMTVTRIIGEAGDEMDAAVKKMQGVKDGDVVCTWFEENQVKEKAFPVKSVEKSEDPGS